MRKSINPGFFPETGKLNILTETPGRQQWFVNQLNTRILFSGYHICLDFEMNLKTTLFLFFVSQFLYLGAQNPTVRQFPQPKGFVEAVESTDSLFYVVGDFSEVNRPDEVIRALDSNNNYLPAYFDFVDFDYDRFDMFYRFNRLNDSLLYLVGEFSSSEHSYWDMVILGADGDVKYTPNSPGPKYFTHYKEDLFFNEDSMHIVAAYDNSSQASGDYDIITRKLQGNDITMVRNRRIEANMPWNLRFISLVEDHVYYVQRDTATSLFELMVYNHYSHEERKLFSFSGKMGSVVQKTSQSFIISGQIDSLNGNSHQDSTFIFDSLTHNVTPVNANGGIHFNQMQLLGQDTLIAKSDVNNVIVCYDLATQNEIYRIENINGSVDFKKRESNVYFAGKSFSHNNEQKFFTNFNSRTGKLDSLQTVTVDFKNFDYFSNMFIYSYITRNMPKTTPSTNIVSVNKETFQLSPLFNKKGSVSELVQIAGDTFVIAGDLDSLNNQAASALTFLNMNSGAIIPGMPEVNGRVNRIRKYDETLYVFGDFDTVNQVRVSKGAFAFNTTTGTVDTLGFSANNKVLDINIYDTVTAFAGLFTEISGEPASKVVFLTSDSFHFVDAPLFIPNNKQVSHITRQGPIFGFDGDFIEVNSNSSYYHVRYDYLGGEPNYTDLRICYIDNSHHNICADPARVEYWGNSQIINYDGAPAIRKRKLLNNDKPFFFISLCARGFSPNKILVTDDFIISYGVFGTAMIVEWCPFTFDNRIAAFRNNNEYPVMRVRGEIALCKEEKHFTHRFPVLDENPEGLTFSVQNLSGQGLDSIQFSFSALHGVFEISGKRSDTLTEGTIVITATDDSGLSTTDTLTVIHRPQPEVNFNLDEVTGILKVSTSFENPQWFFGDSLLAGQTAHSLFPVKTGWYKLRYNFGGCTFIDSFLVDVLHSANETTAQADVKIFPNPSQGDFSLIIESGEHDYYLIDIYTLTGTLIKSETCRVNQRINLNLDVSGYYLVHIKKPDGSALQILPIVVKR